MANPELRQILLAAIYDYTTKSIIRIASEKTTIIKGFGDLIDTKPNPYLIDDGAILQLNVDCFVATGYDFSKVNGNHFAEESYYLDLDMIMFKSKTKILSPHKLERLLSNGVIDLSPHTRYGYILTQRP